MLETMGEDYIRTARAKGLPRRTVVIKHGLRAALTPIVTIFGIDIGTLIGITVITETVFNLRGLGYALDPGDPAAGPARSSSASRSSPRFALVHRQLHRRHPLRGHRPARDASDLPTDRSTQ